MRSSVEKEGGPGIRTVEGLRITSSFGVASIKLRCKTLAELVDQADQALYKAKKAGRNRVVAMDALAVSEEVKTQEVPASSNVAA
jgi:diguanylate cyclase (GGDEF)-like protein